MYYIALAVIILIFIWRMATGFRRGMVQELISLVAMVAAGVCMVLILGAVGSYFDKEIGQVIQTVLVLLVVCFAYRLVHLLFTSLELVSKLPLIKGVDKLLGLVIGFLEAGLVVILLVQLLKNWGISFFDRI